MTNPQRSLHETIEQDGCAIAPGVLSSDEIATLKAAHRRHFAKQWVECDCGKHQPNGVLECPEITWLFSHAGIIAAMREALGSTEILFTGNCDLHQSKLGNWHKDMGEIHGGYLEGNVLRTGDCRIYKVGIYLQDHTDDRSGFNIKRGTHRMNSAEGVQAEHLNSRAGDILIFDVRLTHAGMLPDPMEYAIMRGARFLSTKGKENRIGRFLRKAWWKLTRKPDRGSIFFTYGLENEYTRQFAANSSDLAVPDHLTSDLADQGVKTCDL